MRYSSSGVYHIRAVTGLSPDIISIGKEITPPNWTSGTYSNSQFSGDVISGSSSYTVTGRAYGSNLYGRLSLENKEIFGSDNSFLNGEFGIVGYAGNSLELYFNHMRIRKYTSPEPTLTLGAEQPVSTPTPTPTPTPIPTSTQTPMPTPAPTTPVPTTSAPKQPCLAASHTTLKEEPEVGEEVLITLTIQNTCDGAAKNIRLTEQLPSSITVSYIDGATSNTLNLVTWNGELAPNRAHAIVHTLKIVEKKGRAIPVIIRYEDEAGNQKESSTKIYVEPQVPGTPTPVTIKAPGNPGQTVQDLTVKAPGFTAPLVLLGLLAVIVLARRR